MNDGAHSEGEPAKVEQYVDDRLARSVIRHLAPAVRGDDGDSAGGVHVLAPPRLSEGVDGRVFHQPDLVRGVGRARLGVRAHLADRPLAVPTA